MHLLSCLCLIPLQVPLHYKHMLSVLNNIHYVNILCRPHISTASEHVLNIFADAFKGAVIHYFHNPIRSARR